MDVKFYSHHDETLGYLSNYYEAPTWIDGRCWKTNEHYFQAMKFPSDEWLLNKVCAARTPNQAKVIGNDHSLPLRPDWESVKVDVMRTGLRNKFDQHPDLWDRLKGTRGRRLVEHTRFDRYWADGGDGSGLNMLGRLLVEYRDGRTAREDQQQAQRDQAHVLEAWKVSPEVLQGLKARPQTTVPSMVQPQQQTMVPSKVQPQQTMVPSKVQPQQTMVPSKVQPQQTMVPSKVQPQQTMVPSKVQPDPQAQVRTPMKPVPPPYVPRGQQPVVTQVQKTRVPSKVQPAPMKVVPPPKVPQVNPQGTLPNPVVRPQDQIQAKVGQASNASPKKQDEEWQEQPWQRKQRKGKARK